MEQRKQRIAVFGAGGHGKVVADVPLARMFGYPTTLRSLTSGAGEVATEPVGYAPIG